MRIDFCDVVASGSRTSYKGKETTSIPLRSDPFIGKDQKQFNIRPCKESESTGLVKSFLHSCMNLLRDECVMLEM